MAAALIVLLVGLALVDSLNPFTIAAQAYLLSTPRPLPRSLAFTAGTAATYFSGGVLLLGSWSAIRAWLIAVVPGWGWGAAELALGVGLGGFATWSWIRGTAGKPFTPPHSLGMVASFGLAALSTVWDLPTALPLFAAVDRIAAAGLPLLTDLLLLAIYVLVYVLPLVALIAIRTRFAAHSDRMFEWLRSAVDRGFSLLLPAFTALAAAYLLIDGGMMLSQAN
jgi:cytochrome c biogenesis protein CcdA